MVSTCTCPDPKCRVHWKSSVVGAWQFTTAPHPFWGRQTINFHPDDEKAVRGVARKYHNNAEVRWVAPTEEN